MQGLFSHREIIIYMYNILAHFGYTYFYQEN